MQERNEIELLKIFEKANEIVMPLVWEHFNALTGAYFCVADRKTGEPLKVELVGEVLAEKADKYFNLSMEKAERLAKTNGGISSFQTRNPKEGKWGGAIIASDDYIFSISGFPEIIGEYATLRLAFALYGIKEEYSRIAAISDNRFWKKFIHTNNVGSV